MEPFQSPDVKAVFDAYPAELRDKLMVLRQQIFEVAADDPGIGPLEESLKWGQPSYLTPKSKSGTTIRIDKIKNEPGGYGMYVNCQTTLMASYRELYANALTLEGKRCVRFQTDTPPPEDMVKTCIRMALTYHLNKNKSGLPF